MLTTCTRSPYTRETYRYTPLLALLLMPNEAIHRNFGKLLFSLCDIGIGLLLHRILQLSPSQWKGRRLASDHATWWIAGLWLLNPMSANISTRGSAESALGLQVMAILLLVIQQRLDFAAVLLGVAVHFKIYPFIYGASILAFIGKDVSATGRGHTERLLTRERVRFTLLSLASFGVLNLTMYGL